MSEPASVDGLRDLVREVLAEVLRDADLAGQVDNYELSEAETGIADDVVAPEPVIRVERGALTEAKVREAAQAGARVVLGARAVMTPLARDRARSAGVVVERES
jgi:hypothetical protein